MSRRVQDWEGYYDRYGELLGLPAAEKEHKFHPARDWAIDRVYRNYLVAVEIEGGVWSGGRHVRGQGFLNDCEKYNAAQLAGWMVLRFSPQQVENGECWETIRTALEARGWRGQ